MSSVLETVKWFLWKNAHAKTESNSKGEKDNILKMIRAILTDVLLVGLEWNITMPQESITFNSKKNIKRENTEKYKEKNKQHHENKKNKIQENKTKHYKNKEKYCEKNSKYREENK